MKFAFWAKLLTTVSLGGSVIASAAGIGAWTQPNSDSNNLNLVQTQSTMAAASTSLPFSQPKGIPDHAQINNITAGGNYVYVGTYNGLYWSSDNGQSFSHLSGAIPDDVIIENVTVSGNYVYVGTVHYGLYWSTDNGWSFSRPSGAIPNDASIWNVTVSGNYVYVGTYDNGLYWSSDNGQNFNHPSGAILNDAHITNVAVSGKYVYVGTDENGLYWSTDNGWSFSRPSGAIPDDAGIENVTVNGNYVYVGTYNNGLYWSSDNGQSFSRPSSAILNDTHITNVTVSGKYVYVGTEHYGLYWSIDNGRSFSQTTGTIPTYAGINNVTVNGNYMYVGTEENGLYWSIHNGRSFSRPSGAIPDDAWINNVTVNGNYMYVGTVSNGLYWSTDNGWSFSRPSGAIPGNAWIKNVTVIDPGQGYGVYVGTYGFGIDENGLWISSMNTADLFTTSDQPFIATESNNGYNGWVFNQPQLIKTDNTYLKKAEIDKYLLTNPSVFVLGTINPSDPTQQLAKHQLTLTFKYQYQQFAWFFGGNPDTGMVSFNLWVKTNINQNNIKYSVNFGEDLDDTKTAVGGNVDGCPVIMTKRNDSYTQFPAALIISTSGDDLKMIDYSKSYYVAGTVSDNNFTATGQQQPVTDSFYIATNGIYQLVFTDYVGNQYTSYLELGKDNHIIKTKTLM